MNTEQKERLAMTRDASEVAAGHRLKAARLVTTLSQEKLGDEGGVSKAAVNNSEKGRSFPGRSLMLYLYRQHRIDFNFLIHGDFAQLPLDVQECLFEKLATLENVPDQK